MKTWQLSPRLFPILLVMLLGTSPLAVLAAEEAPPLSKTHLQFVAARFGEVIPQPPIAGQPAQLRFNIALSANGNLPDGEIVELLRQRLLLKVADDSISNNSLSISIVGREQASSTAEAEVTATFVWPNSASGAGLLGYGGTVVQIVNLSDSAGRALVARPVSVSIPTSKIFYYLVASVATYVVALIGIYFLRQRRRRTETEKNLVRREGGESLDPSELSPDLRSTSDGFLNAPEIDSSAFNAQTSSAITQSVERIELPDALVFAVAAGQGVLVVGQGVSAQAGVPTGASLLLSVLHKLGESGTLPSYLQSIAKATNPGTLFNDVIDQLGGSSKVMDILISLASRDQVAALIAEAVRDAPPSSPLHQTLAQFPWKAVVDLTWDSMVERSFVEYRPTNSPGLTILTLGESVGLTKALRGSERLLLKPYGDFNRPSRLALTTEDLRRNIGRSKEFQRALSGLFQLQSFLFLGVEPDLLEQFLYITSSDSENLQPKHFALLPFDPVNEFRAESLARFGVQLLPFDPTASGPQLSQFFKDMQRGVRRSDPVSGTGRQYALSTERVTRLRLESIGPFDSLDLILHRPDMDADNIGGTSPWSVIFGGNGVGKSCILRALALALAGDAPAALDAGKRLLRASASEGLIEVQVGEQVFRTRLIRDRSSVIVSSSQPTPVQTGSALVLGFPALRGARSAEPSGPSAMVEVSDPDPADLVALISGEVDGRLADFKQWLVNILVQADKGSERAVAMRTLLNGIISDMVPGQIHALAPLAQDDFIIRVETPEGVIPLDDLSQGMASIFNWVGLLVQRLFTICDRSERPQDEPAIVIIDEIDAHLHPEWQRRLVMLTRRHFPQLQVIATSHSPLLAGALRRHELAVLERNIDTGEVEQLTSVGETYGLPSQDIMTSPVFGMATDRNPAVEQLIYEYFEIFEKPYRSAEEEAELARLSDAIRRYRYAQPIDMTPLDLSDEAIADLSSRLGTIKDATAS